MVVTDDGRWHPGIGDPNATGWITVVAYGLACLLCGWCARRRGLEPERRFWWLMTGVMLLLGINKQLDLQSWFTEVARDLALAGGWYKDRRTVQAVFILGLGLAMLGLKAWMDVRLIDLHRYTRLAGTGLLILGAFVLLRAASFHHVDAMLGLHFADVRLNAVLELGGIGVIVYAAARYLRAYQKDAQREFR